MDTVKTQKHTPGPWHVDNHQDANHCVINPRAGNWIAVLQHNGELHAPQQEANARLMAAAPNLLAQCRAALRYLQHPDVQAITHGFALPGSVIERRIEEAISEAEGGQS